jgi:type I restriction enzyme R subunit
MSQDKTPPHIKLNERNHVEKPQLSHLDRLGWDTTALLKDTEVASL